jgi:transcriptional regulator of heat shock response
MGQDPERELFWDGAAWLLEAPELAENLVAVRSLLESLQRKSQLLNLLDGLTREPGRNGSGLRVVMGDDWPDPAARGLAMVVAPFGTDSAGAGVLGIVGSQSLRYDTTIPLVRRVARLATLASARL